MLESESSVKVKLITCWPQFLEYVLLCEETGDYLVIRSKEGMPLIIQYDYLDRTYMDHHGHPVSYHTFIGGAPWALLWEPGKQLIPSE